MGIDLDPLEDIFADEPVKKAPAVGKFQPKLKPRPPKKASAATSLSLPAQTNDSSEVVSTAKPSENNDQLSSVTVSPLHHEAPNKDVAETNANVHSDLEFVDCSDRVEKSGGENADIFIGLEALDDFVPHDTTETEGTASLSEEVALHIINPENAEGGLATPYFSTVTDSTHMPNAADASTCPEPTTDSDPLTSKETIICRSEGGVSVDNRGMEEEIDVMDSMNMSELTAKSVQRTGKFQPKPKLQIQKKNCSAGSKSDSDQPGLPPVPPEIGSAENFSSFEHDDVLDLSSIGFIHSEPTEATTENPLNEEFLDLMNITQLDSVINVEGAPEVPAKLASRRAKTRRKEAPIALDPSLHQQEDSTSIQVNETGRSLRPRKRKTSLHDQIDEIPSGTELSDEFVIGSPIEEDNIDDQILLESESNTKKMRQKSKGPHDVTEKPDKKRRKTKEASGQSTDAKPKKFSHSTRRRRVDKVLLETPEDEIEFQKVPLRDLLILADYKERQTKKEEAAAGKSATKQSSGNPSARHDKDETLNSREDGEYDDGEEIPMSESNIYLNYQTYMDKEPRAKWSKQDTELFYEGVQQFGTDLSMIQHLFPGRSRRQIKLKYKKEERQHPLMLRDALTNRPKDHSHFNMVIERLKQIAAEENQNADKDESIDLTGGEVGEERSLNDDDDDGPKNEHTEDATNDDTVEAAPSPVKPSYDSEDDLFDWSQYKSDI